MSTLFGIVIMCDSCHNPNVLIGLKYNIILDIYLLFAIWMGQMQSKLIYILLMDLPVCNLQVFYLVFGKFAQAEYQKVKKTSKF